MKVYIIFNLIIGKSIVNTEKTLSLQYFRAYDIIDMQTNK